MSFIYCTRPDKNGGTLTTSYTSEKTADKYGGANSKRWEGERRIAMDGSVDENSSMIVRSKLVSVAAPASSGAYGVYYKDTDGLRWINAFASYGDANAYMKAVASIYPELYVIYDENYGSGELESNDPW
jgi:hypothetical protein